ncbi:amidophosphoribosyltransferase [bacterium]|nr:amidophosphoribosyltransferase [bacterium]
MKNCCPAQYMTLGSKPREECGVFGVWAPHLDISRLLYFGLFALQHRGQESAGMAVSVGNALTEYRGMGLVSQVFDERILNILRGQGGIGHVRYSTTGSAVQANAQPIFLQENGYKLALGHNGNLVNTRILREKLKREGVHFETTNDSEVMAKLLMKYYSTGMTIEEAVEIALPQCQGAFTLAIITPRKVICLRDPLGVRPLCIGKQEQNGKTAYFFSSESAALDIVNAELIREVQPGEAVVFDMNGMKSFFWTEEKPTQEKICMFEFIYFARPDSYILGRLLHLCRQKMGTNLAGEVNFDADIVISVPDSGTPHAIGLAKATGIPFMEGLIKNRYVGRTFISPSARMRKTKVRMKLNPLKEVMKNKRVILVDDSIVRGNTSKQIIELIRDAGAKEVHMAVASPPVKYPCFYGIDTATQEELIASQMTIPELTKFLGADSVNYLSIDGLIDATGLKYDQFCLACLNDKYPIPIKHQLSLTKLALEPD